MSKKRQRKPQVYLDRDRLIRDIGHLSYSTYLQSITWSKIRKRVWARDGGVCQVCRRPAVSVHHRKYDRDTLLGKTLDHMICICGSCHKSIERERGEKVAGHKVEKRLVELTRVTDRDRKFWQRQEPIDQEFLAMFRD